MFKYETFDSSQILIRENERGNLRFFYTLSGKIAVIKNSKFHCYNLGKGSLEFLNKFLIKYRHELRGLKSYLRVQKVLDFFGILKDSEAPGVYKNEDYTPSNKIYSMVGIMKAKKGFMELVEKRRKERERAMAGEDMMPKFEKLDTITFDTSEPRDENGVYQLSPVKFVKNEKERKVVERIYPASHLIRDKKLSEKLVYLPSKKYLNEIFRNLHWVMSNYERTGKFEDVDPRKLKNLSILNPQQKCKDEIFTFNYVLLRLLLGKVLKELPKGAMFGERALENHRGRTASIITLESSEFLTLDADEYKRNILKFQQIMRQDKFNLMRFSIPCINDLSTDNFWRFQYSLKKIRFKEGDNVVSEGEESSFAFVIISGSCSVLKSSSIESIKKWRKSLNYSSSNRKHQNEILDDFEEQAKYIDKKNDIMSYVSRGELCCTESLYSKKSLSLFTIKVVSEHLEVYKLEDVAKELYFTPGMTKKIFLKFLKLLAKRTDILREKNIVFNRNKEFEPISDLVKSMTNFKKLRLDLEIKEMRKDLRNDQQKRLNNERFKKLLDLNNPEILILRKRTIMGQKMRNEEYVRNFLKKFADSERKKEEESSPVNKQKNFLKRSKSRYKGSTLNRSPKGSKICTSIRRSSLRKSSISLHKNDTPKSITPIKKIRPRTSLFHKKTFSLTGKNFKSTSNLKDHRKNSFSINVMFSGDKSKNEKKKFRIKTSVDEDFGGKKFGLKINKMQENDVSQSGYLFRGKSVSGHSKKSSMDKTGSYYKTVLFTRPRTRDYRKPKVEFVIKKKFFS